jgi:Kef-type K+ transport system membrane component KefB
MSTHFFLVLCAFLAVPALIGKLLGNERLLPSVFVQLLFGVTIQLSGLSGWLQSHGVDLLEGQLGASIQGIGWLGIALLVALTGADAMPAQGERPSWQFAWVSLLGFGVTLAAGTALGLVLQSTQPALAGPNATPLIFAIAVGTCLAVTALPVLIAILRESGLSGSRVGKLAILSALLDDLWLWLGLMAILSFAGLRGPTPFQTLVPLCAYLGIMFGVVKPFLRNISVGHGAGTQGAVLGVCVILLSAAVTEALGVHAMLGAFIGGAVLPHAAVKGWGPGVSHVVKTMLMPVFFVSTGLRLRVDWNDPHFWTLVAVFSITAMGVKATTVALVARATGLDWSRSLLMGTLMQCKGLMELVAINILHEAGIIGTQTYSALAVMALISTLVTAPLLRIWTSPKRLVELLRPLPAVGTIAQREEPQL